MQLVSKFSCKINIERNGTRVLGPKLNSTVFNVSMHEANKLLQISISPKDDKLELPKSPYIPRRFTNQNIHKVSKQCISQGKLGITLLNYSSSIEGYTVYSNPPILTCIYISEAPIEALQHFWLVLQQGPSKRDAIQVQEEREKLRQKPRPNPWRLLNSDVLLIIFSFLGEKLGKYGLVCRKWAQMVGELAKSLRFNYAKDVSGDIIIRTIKRHPYLSVISLTDCRNLSLAHIKRAMGLPLRHLKRLDLERCKKLNSQALFSMILNTPKLAHINLIETSVDDTFFQDLNPQVHLKNLSSISCSSLTSVGVSSIVCKYPKILRFELHVARLTSELVSLVFRMPSLIEVKLYYETAEFIEIFKPCSQLQVVEILPTDRIEPRSDLMTFWDCLAGSNLKHIGCNLTKDCLVQLLKYWPNLISARLCEYFPLPKSVIKLSLYFNEDFDEEIRHADGEKWMTSLKHLEVIMPRLEYSKTEQINTYFRKHYPSCRLLINSF